MRPDAPDSGLARQSALTAAEQSVLDQALTDVSAREIAQRLTLGEATVRSHLSSIYVKLGVSGRVALLAAFREADAPARHSAIGSTTGVPRPPAVAVVVGWGWIVVNAVLGAAVLYQASWLLAGYGGQSDWLTFILTLALAALTFAVGRRMLVASRRSDALRSLALSGVYLVGFAGSFLAGPIAPQPSLVMSAAGAILAWLSFRAFRAFRALPPES